MSLRLRIQLMAGIIVLMTSLAIFFVARQQTSQSLLSAHEENARNLAHTVALNVELEYRNLLHHRSTVLEARKAELKNIITIALSHLDWYHSYFEWGLISERDAQKRAINEIRQLRYDDGTGYIWINDMGRPIPKMIMHPTLPELDGELMDDPHVACP